MLTLTSPRTTPRVRPWRVDPDEEEKLESLSAEMLRLHHKFNHISFGKEAHLDLAHKF